MFAYDAKALSVAKRMIERGIDDLPLPMFYNVLLPFEHSENLEDQRACLDTADRKIEASPEELKVRISQFRGFALKHFEIIEKFGTPS
jgi:uncharacterized protein (DUF924 family)